MKSYDFEAVIYNGAVYCIDCCPVDVDSEDVMPIFADQEWEYIPICEVCGAEHDYVSLISCEE